MKSIKVKPQKPTPRLHKLLMRAHKIFEREYPGHDVAIQPVFLQGDDIQQLCKKSGMSGRFGASIIKRGKNWIIFDVDLHKMPDDFVLFNFLHELIHAGFEETNEAKVISMTFDVMKKLGIDRDDFMQRYQHLLTETYIY